MRLPCIFLILITTIPFLYSQNLSDYYPQIQGELVEHEYISLDYNEMHEQANWVIYFAGMGGMEERANDFREDPKVSTGSASANDYKQSGFDRGHLAPAADMKINETAMSESFYLSNISPQDPYFNRTLWRRLETLMRAWSDSIQSETDVIITGPILGDPCGVIGNNVTVPCRFYKIYADIEKNRMIGFVMGMASDSKDLTKYVLSIDEIEELTGIDFFYRIGDSLEIELEKQLPRDNYFRY